MIEDLSFLTELPVVTLLIGFVLAIGAVLSRLSRFMGVPAGLLFLGAGMLLGEDGPGKIDFHDYDVTYAIGSIALGLILFHGGLSTPLETLRRSWRPALVLATVGVVGVTFVTGLGIWMVPPPEGKPPNTLAVALLIGAILGSTDAAAVFDLLAKQRLKGRARAILEVESGLNDPMAFVLVFAFTDIVAFGSTGGAVEIGLGMLASLAWQLTIGGVIGVLVGLISARLLRIGALGGAALYPILTIAIALISLGLTMILGGSGLLAAYITGMVLGNRNIPFRATTERVHDTVAWLSQITMFFLLGLLVTPSILPQFIVGGIVLALFVAFVSRPLVVGTILALFRVPWRENALISWSGIRGAVPIILTTIPVLVISAHNEDKSDDIRQLFGFIFMVVVAGTIVPGAFVRPVAKLLRMRAGVTHEPAVEIDFVAGDKFAHRYETYRVPKGAIADHIALRDLKLPAEASIVMVLRESQFFPPRGDTFMKAGDHVTIVFDPDVRDEVEAIFSAPQDEM